MTQNQQPAARRSLYDITGNISDTNTQLITQVELNGLHDELETLREKLKLYEDLGDAGSDVQLLRTGYAAARLEIESLKSERDRFRVAYHEWSDKTEWVRKSTTVNELGKHLADVLRERIEGLQADSGRITNPSGAADLPEALRVPLDSLHADAGCLCGRLLSGSMTREQVVASIRRRIDAAKLAALAAGQATAAQAAGCEPVACALDQQGFFDKFQAKYFAEHGFVSTGDRTLHDQFNHVRAWAWGSYQQGLAAAQPAPPAQPAAQRDIENLRKALQFYAGGEHFIKSEPDAWDTVSGEPQHYWCDEAGTATVEDGHIARLALSGRPVLFEDDTAQPAAQQGVAYAALPDPLEIDWPELHSQALGCGVEDRNLHNRYECAEYGWQDGVDKCAERVPEQIFDADQMRAFADDTHALRASHGQAPAGAETQWRYALPADSVQEGAAPHGRCQHCVDLNDGFYGSYAPPCPYHDDDGKPRAAQEGK
jgi:hypothetical protein